MRSISVRVRSSSRTIKKRLDRTKAKIPELEAAIKATEVAESEEEKGFKRQLDFAKRDVPFLEEELELATEAAKFPKDINKYKMPTEGVKMTNPSLVLALKAAEALAETQFDRTKAEYEIVYDDDDWVVYRPTNKEAAVLLGSGSDWCVSKWRADHYEQYMDKASVHNISGEPVLYVIENKKDRADNHLLYGDTDNQIWEFRDFADNEYDYDNDEIDSIVATLEMEPEGTETVYYLAHSADSDPMYWSTSDDFADMLSYGDENLELRGEGYEIYQAEVKKSAYRDYVEGHGELDSDDVVHESHYYSEGPETETVYVVTAYEDKERLLYFSTSEQGVEDWVEDNKEDIIKEGESWTFWELEVPVHQTEDEADLFDNSTDTTEGESGPPPLPNTDVVLIVDTPDAFEVYVKDTDEEKRLIGKFPTELEAYHAAAVYERQDYLVLQDYEEINLSEKLYETQPPTGGKRLRGREVTTPDGIGKVYPAVDHLLTGDILTSKEGTRFELGGSDYQNRWIITNLGTGQEHRLHESRVVDNVHKGNFIVTRYGQQHWPPTGAAEGIIVTFPDGATRRYAPSDVSMPPQETSQGQYELPIEVEDYVGRPDPDPARVPREGPRANDIVVWADDDVSFMGQDTYEAGGLERAKELQRENPGLNVWEEVEPPYDPTVQPELDIAPGRDPRPGTPYKPRTPPVGESTFRLVRARRRTAAGELVERRIDELAGRDLGMRQQLEEAARRLYAEGYEDWEVAAELEQTREQRRLEEAPHVPGAELVDHLGDYAVYRIDTFEAAKRLGTRNWCMVRSNDIWDEYASQGVTFWFHVNPSKGPPAEYAVGEMTRDGHTATETWDANDEVQLEDIGGVSSWHTERGSVDLGVEFYSLLKDVIAGDLQAQYQLLRQPRTDEAVGKFFALDRLPSTLLVDIAGGFRPNIDSGDLDADEVLTWLGDAGRDEPEALETATRTIIARTAGRRTAALTAVHNLSAENLRNVLRTKGLLAPSIAITEDSNPFTNFGDITLVAPMDLVDPAEVPVFNADIYSPRHPHPRHAPDKKKTRSFYDEIRPYGDRTDVYLSDIDDIVDRGGPEEVVRRATPALQLAFLEQVKGQTVQDIMKDKPIEPAWVTAPSLGAFFTQEGVDTNARMDTPYWDAFSRAAQQSMREYWGSQEGLDAEDVEWFVNAAEKRWLGSDSSVQFGSGWQIFDAYNSIGKQQVDRTAYRDELERMIAPFQDEFAQWATARAEGLVKGQYFLTSGGARRKYTPENLLKHQTSKTRGGENFDYGVGSIRAMGAKRFRNMRQMENAAGNLVSEEEMKEVKTDLTEKYLNLVTDLDHYHPSERSTSALSEALREASKRGKSLQNELRLSGFRADDIPDWKLEELHEYMQELRNAPTQYFEAKPQRVVGLSEFERVIIPEDASPETIALLESYGLPIQTYASDEERARLVQQRPSRTASAKQVVRLGDHTVSCEVAETLAKQARGLQGHAPLSDGAGMLFPYKAARDVTFWMGNVSFPIDVVFVEGANKKTAMHKTGISMLGWDYEEEKEAIQEVIDGEGWDCDETDIAGDEVDREVGDLISALEAAITDYEDNVQPSKDFNALSQDLTDTFQSWIRLIVPGTLDTSSDAYKDLAQKLTPHYNNPAHDVYRLLDRVYNSPEVQDANKELGTALDNAASEACQRLKFTVSSVDRTRHRMSITSTRRSAALSTTQNKTSAITTKAT